MRKSTFMTIFLGGLVGLASSATAEPKPEPPPGYATKPETAKAFSDLRARVDRPQRWMGANARVGKVREVQGKLLDFVDGMVRVSRPVTAAERKVLLAQGVPEVESLRDLMPRVLHEGALVVTIEVDGVSNVHFESREGRRVRLDVQRRRSGRVVVVGITDAR